MVLRALIIGVIITVLGIGVVSLVYSQEKQNADKEAEIIKMLDQVIKNQETIMRDLKYIKSKV